MNTSSRTGGDSGASSMLHRAAPFSRPHPPYGALASIELKYIPGGAVLLDEAGRIVDANAAVARIFGRRRRELRGHALAEWIPDFEALDAPCGGSRRRFELTGLRAYGARTTLRLALSPVLVAGENYTLVFITDCERRKALELQARDAHYGMHQMARTLPHMVWTCDPDGAAVYVSADWIGFTGQPRDRQLGDGWLDCAHPDDREQLMKRWSAARKRKGVFKAEFRARRADGEYRWFESTCVPVRDRNAAVVRWMGLHVDVHDAREAQRLLTEERDHFMKIAATAPCAIYACRTRPDGAAGYSYASEGLSRLYGLSGEALANDVAAVERRMHPQDAALVRSSALAAARELSHWRCSWRVFHPQRGVIRVEGVAAPMRDVDGAILWCGVITDVSERDDARTTHSLRGDARLADRQGRAP